MNQVLDNRYLETFQRLALGLEPIDAMRLHRVGPPLRIEVERPPKATAKPPVLRHASCLHALLYYPALVDSVDIRIFEGYPPFDPSLLDSQQLFPRRFVLRRFRIPSFDPSLLDSQQLLPRRFVPRRFRIPLHTVANADTFPYTDRVRRPFVFPGAAYDLDSCATGIRGRVLHGGKPMRWARVEAALPGGGKVVGRAHGDDRGEFLLLIGPEAIPVGDLVSPVNLTVTVFGPATIPVPATPDLPSLDALWDVPQEIPPAPGAVDKVSTGEIPPANYTAKTERKIDFFLGELRSELTAFTIV